MANDYGKMFKDLDPYYPQPNDLNNLATIMSGRTKFPEQALESKSFALHFEAHSPAIPAGYTYLAQFVTHDISFDEHSDRHRREDLPWEIISPEQIKELRNLRKPNFDLETVYGDKEPTNSGEPPRRELLQENSLPLLKLGDTEGTASDGGTAAQSYPCDLPRKAASAEADIVDCRNDENLLLAQTLTAFIKFHNAMVVKLNESGNYKKDELFEKARQLTIRYYQTIILTDFLPRIVQASVIEELTPKSFAPESFYQPNLFIPLEFSAAAFRFGHSMIREKYNLNIRQFDHSPPPEQDLTAKIGELMMFTGRGKMNENTEILQLPSIWIIDWNLFYEIDNSPVNQAEPIDTQVSLGLLKLRPKVETKVNNDGRASSLSALDLYRGRRFGLPTGQDVAAKIGVKPLEPDQIKYLIMRKEIKEVNLSQEEEQKIKESLCTAFAEKSPLWFYILAEAEIQHDGKLGAVGSRIVAETIITLLYHSEYSILRRAWEADEGFLLNAEKFFANPQINTFGMPEMLKFVQQMNEKHADQLYPKMKEKFDELNPLGNG